MHFPRIIKDLIGFFVLKVTYIRSAINQIQTDLPTMDFEIAQFALPINSIHQICTHKIGSFIENDFIPKQLKDYFKIRDTRFVLSPISFTNRKLKRFLLVTYE